MYVCVCDKYCVYRDAGGTVKIEDQENNVQGNLARPFDCINHSQVSITIGPAGSH